MNLPPPPAEPKSARVPKNVLLLMLAVIIAMTLVALYANVQKFRRGKIETTTFVPALSPSASPSPATH